MLAAEQGEPVAQYFVGVAYFTGDDGVTQNDKTAVKWFHLAAEQNLHLAQYFLAKMYKDGRGVIQDFAYAHMWFNIAAANGYDEAVPARSEIESQMTRAQVTEAQTLARECISKEYKGC